MRRPLLLLLDRADNSRAALATELRSEGYDVQEAEPLSPLDAITGLRGALPDAVVLDVSGPEGADLVTRLRVNPVSVFVFTGVLVAASDRLRLLASAVVSKPQTDELIREIRRVRSGRVARGGTRSHHSPGA